MKSLFIDKLFLFLAFMTSCSGLKNTPENVKELTLKIQNRDYTVMANSANPMRGKQIYLTSGYDLQIKNDSAFAYLPYYGVAYTAPYSMTDGGIKFAEPMANYSMSSNRKSDGWDIHFKVKAQQTEYVIYLNVFNNGRAMFSVASFNRDMITFNGEVKK